MDYTIASDSDGCRQEYMGTQWEQSKRRFEHKRRKGAPEDEWTRQTKTVQHTNRKRRTQMDGGRKRLMPLAVFVFSANKDKAYSVC